MASPAILNKINLLLKLTASPEPHEAITAQQLADALIAKHNVSQEELESLEDSKPLYGENDKLFFTFRIVGWMQQLSLAIATYFDCLIVQETLIPAEGTEQYHYYVYGSPEEVAKVKLAFGAFHAKIQEYMDTRCLGRGQVYLDSYGEGMVESIRENIYLRGITLPDRKTLTPTEPTPVKEGEIVPTKKDKQRPADRSVDVNAQSFVKDIAAYFNGIYDGRELSLVDIFTLEEDNPEPEQLT